MNWSVETLSAAVDKELDALPADLRARFSRICQLIANVGLERVGMPHVKHLTGPLWEMRMRGRSGISRALYVRANDRRAVVVRALVKKTPKIPQNKIALALRRAKEVAR